MSRLRRKIAALDAARKRLAAPGLPMTRALAHAAATDAANRRARGRAWSAGDLNAAVREFNRLWPLEREYPWMSKAEIARIRRRDR